MIVEEVRAIALDEVPEAAWDALLSPQSTPFLRYAWLAALEKSGCASRRLLPI